MLSMQEPYQESRPWGWFRQFTHNEETTVKVLAINAGAVLSLQSHEQRSEFWRVLSGAPIVIIDDTETVAKPGDEFFVPQGAKHRLKGGEVDSQVLEIAFGTFDEDDITRYEDVYGRA